MGGGGARVDRPRRISVVLLCVCALLTACAAPGAGVQGYAWGFGGAVASRSAGSSATPVSLTLPEGATGLSAGRDHLLVLAAGRVLTSERSPGGAPPVGGPGGSSWSPVPLPAGVMVTAVSAGTSFSVALADDGSMYTWGVNDVGQLGAGRIGSVTGVQHLVLPSGKTVQSVAAGHRFAVALTTDGEVYGWGDNGRGQQGGEGSAHAAPVAIAMPGSAPVSMVAAGGDHAVAVAGGRAIAWGERQAGVLGGPGADRAPREVALPAPVHAVTAGAGFSVAVLDDGQAWAWGSNAKGQLGNGSTMASPVPVPVRLPTPVDSVEAADQFVVARTSSARLLSWGDNSDGQLGDASVRNSAVPVPVRLPDGVDVSAYAVGGHRAFAMLEAPSSNRRVLIAVGVAGGLLALALGLLVLRHRRRTTPTHASPTRTSIDAAQERP